MMTTDAPSVPTPTDDDHAQAPSDTPLSEGAPPFHFYPIRLTDYYAESGETHEDR